MSAPTDRRGAGARESGLGQPMTFDEAAGLERRIAAGMAVVPTAPEPTTADLGAIGMEVFPAGTLVERSGEEQTYRRAREITGGGEC